MGSATLIITAWAAVLTLSVWAIDILSIARFLTH